jgi:hypothetical protein
MIAAVSSSLARRETAQCRQREFPGLGSPAIASH